MNKSKRTVPFNQFFGNGLIITDFRVFLNKSTVSSPDRDYRVASLEIQLNGSFWVTDIKIFDKRENPGVWYIKRPGNWIKTDACPEGRQRDHVRMTSEQFATLRTYCYERIDEAQDEAFGPREDSAVEAD